MGETLRSYHEQGYLIWILSNQGGLGKGKEAERLQLQRKVDAVIASLNVPVDFICSISKDIMRKPFPGMWDTLAHLRGIGNHMNSEECLYVGDAAGRPAIGKTRKKDFSASDLLFAANIGCKVTSHNYYSLLSS